jgi:hypothetical protein
VTNDFKIQDLTLFICLICPQMFVLPTEVEYPLWDLKQTKSEAKNFQGTPGCKNKSQISDDSSFVELHY